jgi:hypothetical protein
VVPAHARFVFLAPDAPAVRSYTAADAGPGTIFRDSSLGGDIEWWAPGVGGSGGSVKLTIDEATASALRGTLHVNLEFAIFDAAF